jgi:predicted metal-dependent hydrolase
MYLQKEIIVGDSTIRYTHRRSARARRVRLAVQRDGAVVLTTPVRTAERFVEGFVLQHARWIMAALARIRSLPPLDPVARYGRREYLLHREEARAFVLTRIAALAPSLSLAEPGSPGTSVGRVAIRDQKTCWGSCSRKGNLNFNYKILFLPPHLQDYVIVHELAHLRELNHSPRFWALVASAVPDWRAHRRELRGMRLL